MYLVRMVINRRPDKHVASHCANRLTTRRALGKAIMPNSETARRVSLDYTLTAARLFQEKCQKPFRFIYCSGAAVERDQTKPLWFMQEYRRIRV